MRHLCSRLLFLSLFFSLFLVLFLIPAGYAQQQTTVFAFAAQIGKSIATMTSDWRFRTGDDRSWANSALDDSGWKTLKGDSTWGSQTHPGYTGLAWYRRDIDVKT